MLGYRRSLDPEKKSYFVLREPDVFIAQIYFHLYFAVRRCIQQKFRVTIIGDYRFILFIHDAVPVKPFSILSQYVNPFFFESPLQVGNIQHYKLPL
jgi:hypothetical protein